MKFFLYYFYETPHIIGCSGSLEIGEKVAVANTVFNLSSGSIYIGNRTIFSNNVMVLTGRHEFVNGKRASLIEGNESSSWGGGDEEVPNSGFDIHIGQGCWIAAGVIIVGGVKIGDNVIVAANAVVTKDAPDFSILAGVPAKIIGDTRKRIKKSSK